MHSCSSVERGQEVGRVADRGLRVGDASWQANTLLNFLSLLHRAAAVHLRHERARGGRARRATVDEALCLVVVAEAPAKLDLVGAVSQQLEKRRDLEQEEMVLYLRRQQWSNYETSGVIQKIGNQTINRNQ